MMLCTVYSEPKDRRSKTEGSADTKQPNVTRNLSFHFVFVTEGYPRTHTIHAAFHVHDGRDRD